ncbi:MAG: ROK family protein [Coriobacteriia bacterium]|nr:ROK family protein [Coriobacteriia bacterium]
MRAAYALGVDVGATRIAAGLVDRKGRIVKEAKRLTPGNGPFGVVDEVIDAVQEAWSGAHPSEVSGVGVGLPAQIDFLRQSVEFCTNLPLAGVDMRSLIMSRLKHEVTLDNDGHCAALGEHRFGAAKGVRDFLMVTLGTGVGGGMFVDGQPYRGARGLGGEVGHMPVRSDGAPCPCGDKGHLEAYVGRIALGRRGREEARSFAGSRLRELAGGDPEAVTGLHVVEAAVEGDEVARGILLEAGDVLGEALIGLVNLLNPQLVVVGGGTGESAGFLVERAASVMAERALAGRRDARVVQAELGNDAGVLGAAALALDEYDSREGLHR